MIRDDSEICTAAIDERALDGTDGKSIVSGHAQRAAMGRDSGDFSGVDGALPSEDVRIVPSQGVCGLDTRKQREIKLKEWIQRVRMDEEPPNSRSASTG